MMNYEEENERLRAENQELQKDLAQVRELLRLALAHIEEVEKRSEPPEFVKANVKKRPAEEKKPRKKWEAKYNRG